MIWPPLQTWDFRANQIFVRTCASWGTSACSHAWPSGTSVVGGMGGGILGCGSQASHPSHSHCIPSLCPIMPTSATRASHCRPYITSHRPECPASPSPIPGPWVVMANICSTLGVGVQGRQRFGPQSLVLRSTNPTSVPPTRNLTTLFGSLHYFLSWMGTGVCLPGDDLGPLPFLLSKWMPPRPDSLC